MAAEVNFLKSIPVGWWAVRLWDGEAAERLGLRVKLFPTEQEAQTWCEQVYRNGFRDDGSRLQKLHRARRERVLIVQKYGTQGLYYYLPALKDDGSEFPQPRLD